MYALNLTHSPENLEYWESADLLPCGRRPCGERVKDERKADTPGSQTASSYSKTGK